MPKLAASFPLASGMASSTPRLGPHSPLELATYPRREPLSLRFRVKIRVKTNFGSLVRQYDDEIAEGRAQGEEDDEEDLEEKKKT